MTKGKICTIISSCLACIAVVIGITISCYNNFSIKPEDTPIASNWTDNRDTSSNFAGGEGSFGNPYKIATANQLAQLAYRVNNGERFNGKYFEQTNDIDLSGNEWTPIGTKSTNPFSGYYDGKYHIISNLLIINTETNSYQGLFGYIAPSDNTLRLDIKRIGVVNSNISNGRTAGGIVGFASRIRRSRILC